jgi:hypothetical protein
MDHRRKKKITNWELEHHRYIGEWQLFEQNNMRIHAVHRENQFSEYLAWYEQRTRLHLKPAWTEQDIAEIADSDQGNNPYDRATRARRQVEFAPVLTRVVSFKVDFCVI